MKKDLKKASKPREEFGAETDIREITQQNQKAETGKMKASGQFGKRMPNNNSNNTK